jgi:DNA polymerase elongation subunit (family B)
MEDEIKLRGNISKDYKLNCWSWDAPKIASEALLQDYCKITGNELKSVRDQRFEKPTLHLNECLRGFEPGFKLPIFQNLWTEILNSQNSFSKELIVNVNNTSIKLTYGIGGLHSVNENETYISDRDYQVVTSDVASLYPNLIINYNCIRFPEVLQRYLEVKDERIIAKKAKDKSKDLFLKLILNSTSGLLDNQHSWLYFPEGAMRLRLIGQLILTKCIEQCIINKWQVVSANTDGIEVIVPRHMLKQYQEILDMVCNKFKLDLEHEYYNKIVYKNVNNYVAITKDGKYKQKGLFVPNPVLGNSVDELVIAKALEAYYTKDISPKEFITNPKKYGLHIYDYCKSNKIGKDFVVYWNGEIQQQLNRYYFSKKGAYLFKQKYGQGTMQHVNVGQPVIIYNVHKETSWEDYNIDYNYYIASTQKIIDEIANFNQLTLW